MGKVREGRIANTAKHRFVITTKRDFAGHEHRLISHAMMCQLTGHRSIPDYWVYYFSIPRHLIVGGNLEEAAKGVSLRFADRLPSWIGNKFGHVQVPQSLKLIEKMMPSDSCYVGYDTMGAKGLMPPAFLWVSFIGFVENLQHKYLPEDWNNVS